VTNTDGAVGDDNAAGRTAPLPSDDTVDCPIVLNAMTLTVTLAESTRLKGEDLRIATEIEQLLEDNI